MSDTFEVLNPATEDIVKKVHMASPAEVDDVVAKAKKHGQLGEILHRHTKRTCYESLRCW